MASPQQTFVLPADNSFGQPAGTVGTLVADGYVGVIRRLTPGQHTIVNEVVTSEGFSIITTLVVNVAAGQ